MTEAIAFTSLADAGINESGIRTDASGQGRTFCPNCRPHRKREHQNERDLSININDMTWLCHHCGWSGYIPTNPQRLNAGAGSTPISQRPQLYESPRNLPKEPGHDRIADWLQARGITLRTAQAFRLNANHLKAPQDGQAHPTIDFPYFVKGQHVNTKHRTTDDTRHFWMDPGCEQPFYNIDAIDPAKPLIITEGEMDALSCHEAGLTNVVSVPGGAPDPKYPGANLTRKLAFLEPAMELLSAVPQVILATDADDAGRLLQAELARRIGAIKCRRVQWPVGCKDANDVLVTHGTAALKYLLDNAPVYPVVGLYTGEDLEEDLVHAHEHGWDRGVKCGLTELDHICRFTGGRLVIVTGHSGSGKSTVLDNILVGLSHYAGWRHAIYSPEQMPLARHQAQLISIKTRQPFDQRYEHAMSRDTMLAGNSWLSDYFSFVNPEKRRDLDTLLEHFRMEVMRRGVTGIVIDPWNCIADEKPNHMAATDWINKALFDIKLFAQETGTCAFVVAHPTKLKTAKAGEPEPRPTLTDISGCHDATTEYLTRHSGWKTYDQYVPGEEVLAYDPTTGTTRWEIPTAITTYYHNDDMIAFKGYGLDLLVTPNHRMNVKPLHAKWYVPHGETRPERTLPRDWRAVEAGQLLNGEHLTPIAAPLEDEFEEPNHIVLDAGYDSDDFLRLMAWYITEGHMSMRAPSISQNEGSHQHILDLLDRMGVKYRDYVSAPTRKGGTANHHSIRIYARSHPELAHWLPTFCGEGSARKHLPGMVWMLPARQKQILLDTLLLGDGHSYPSGQDVYTTTSPQLADDVQRLAMELGRCAKITPRAATNANHADQWIVNIAPPERTETSIRAVRKSYPNVSVVPYSGIVWCLTVPSDAFVTRRNGVIAFQRNSINFRNQADYGIVVHRDQGDLLRRDLVEISIAKIRMPETGDMGAAAYFKYDRPTGCLLPA